MTQKKNKINAEKPYTMIIEKHKATSFANFLLGQWYWYVEHGYMRCRGGIAFTYKGAERKAEKYARNWKLRNTEFQHIEKELTNV